jgi:hypothetical protein
LVRPVTIDDVVGLVRYEEIRDEFRRRIIALKKLRRVSVGPHVTFVFENFDTVLFQIQEMLRAERIVDLDKVREEIEVYNELIPPPGELSSTMLIELEDPERIREQLPKFYGIDDCVWMEVGEGRAQAIFEGGRSREDKVSAVQYVQFPVGELARPFLEGAPVRIVIEHVHYRETVELSTKVREALAEDLRE